MAKINTLNYQTVAAWNGSQDLFVVEQPDGTKVATPAMVKQFIEAGDFEATGEVEDGHGNKLSDVVNEIGDLSQTGLTGDSVSEQLDTVRGQIAGINSDLVLEKFTPTLATSIGTPEQFLTNCFYNPKTKQVHLDVLIYSASALIPVMNQAIITIPEKYRPSNNTDIGFATVMDNNSWTTQSERCWVSSNGSVGLSNFIYGGKATRIFAIKADYIGK